MRLSMNTEYVLKNPGQQPRSMKNALRLIKANGFSFADINLGIKSDENLPMTETAPILREECERIGIEVNQTHAPFFEGRPMPADYEQSMLDCVRATAVLGAKVMVVHADTWYEENYEQWNRDKVLDTIYEVYAPVAEEAKKQGIRLAMETLFEWQGSLYHRMRFCSFVEELDDIAGRFGQDVAGACWDFGHAHVAYGSGQFDAMRRLKTPIIATHVHDNNRRFDNHNLPYQGTINWSLALRTLAAVGYDGDLTLELGFGGSPDGLIDDYIRYSHSVAAHMAAEFAVYRQNPSI